MLTKVVFSLNLALIFLGKLDACSRIFWDNPINKVAARTMDLYFDEKPLFTLFPRGTHRSGEAGPNSIEWTSKYGTLVITGLEGKLASEGLNEKGLSAHLLYLHDTEYEKRDDRPGISNGIWIQYLLDNFSTVDEAVQSLNEFQVVPTEIIGRKWPVHVSLEDKTGNSAIIEYVKGRIVVHVGPQFTVMTNEPPYELQLKNLNRYRYFGGNLPLPGDIDSVSRFVRCSAFLKTLTEPKSLEDSIGYIFSVIRTVQVPYGAKDTSSNQTEDSWTTRWVSATDVTNLTYYFNSTSLPNIFWVDLTKLNFFKGQPVKSIDVQNSKFVGDISSQFMN